MDPTAGTLDATTLIQKISADEVSRDFLLLASRGFLPFPQEDMVAVLAHLAVHPDTEVSQQSRSSLKELPSRVVLTFARHETVNPEHLDALAKATEDPAVLEAIVRSRRTPDQTIERMARSVSPSLQEVIVINQERILRSPTILDSLLSNPGISPDVYRRVMETREEFFEKKARAEERAKEMAQYALDEAEKTAFQDLLDAAAALDAAGAASPDSLPELPPGEDAEKVSVWNKIFHMTISEKVQVALKGGRTERSILIRERNRLVVAAVVRSPRMTETEIEAFAGMRNIEEEALRIIGMNRQWMSKYPLMASLVKNPKAPVGVVLPLIVRLTLRDLKGLSSDKGVSEAVRSMARKLYQTRRVNS